jgi:hypothetical protein
VGFWIPWTVDAIVAAVAVVFFLIGVADGSVSSFNIVLWIVLLGALAGFVGGSLWLRSKGHRRAAIALLWVLAAPGVLAGLLMVLLIVNPPRWN